MKKEEHIESCFERNNKPCPANKSIWGEKPAEHAWSGFPGAYCMKCFTENTAELCLGTSCKCRCHDEFWKEYEAYCEETADKNE